MTEPSPTPHLDLDGLADHLAGESDASGHLSACGGCTARLAELEAAERQVVAVLRALPVPPLPTDVADRIAAALAAEPSPVSSTLATSTSAPVTAGLTLPATGATLPATATVTPLTAARERRTWLPSVAAAGVLVAGGLLGYSLLTGSGGNDESADSASPASAGAAESAATFPTVATGVDYADPGTVAAVLPQVLDGSAPGVAADSAPASVDPSLSAAQVADPLARLREPTALADCLAAVLDPATPDERPLALDFARYSGAPALAIVLADPDPAKLSVFVVGPDCSRADDDLAFFTRLDRP